MGAAIPIEVSNVAEFIYGHDAEALAKNPKELDLKRDFTNAAPPYSAAWYEWEEPLSNLRKNTPQVGMLLASLPEIDFDSWMQDFPGGAKWLRESFQELKERVHWVLWGELFFDMADMRRVVGPMLHCFVVLDASGSILDLASFSPTPKSRTADTVWEFFEGLTQCIAVPLMANCFMHCRNVRQVTQKPPEKLSRAFARRHAGKELISYRTIEIDPMRKVLVHEGGMKHNGLRRALHICRGHFKTYSPEKPLLGRTSGTFFWPSHVRGAAEEGLVIQSAHLKPVGAGGVK